MLESKNLEFKQTYTDAIKYTVVAFANTDGGKLYIGVDDDGSVLGVEDADGTMLRVTNMIRDAVRPDVTMFTDCTVEQMEGKAVVVLTVQRGTARPYYIAGKSVRPEGVYVRHASSSVPASEAAILSMIKETGGDSYEDARSINQQLTFDSASAYFSKKGLEFGEAQKRTLNIISRDGTYSNLGMLLSDQCVHTIKMAVFDGSKKSVFRDRRELTGSLLEQLEEAYGYIDRFNRTKAEFLGLERIDRRDYPVEALREALLNAIVHRDYAISGSTLISIFDDRIEIATIGGLTHGISFDDIMLGISVLRNQRLANVFYRLRLIEAYGTGILKINECYAECSVKPLIAVTDNAFKVTLPNLNYNSQDSDITASLKSGSSHVNISDVHMSAIIDLFERRESIVRKDIESALNVSQSTAVLILRELVREGMLIKESGGKYVRYRLAPK